MTRVFTFTNAADSAYHNLYDSIVAITGVNPSTGYFPSSVAGLLMVAGGSANISDSNSANVVGVPLAANVPLSLSFSDNLISLKSFFVKGSAVTFSGIVTWR